MFRNVLPMSTMFLLAFLLGSSARAQETIPQPADSAKDQAPTADGERSDPRTRSDQAPANYEVTVTTKKKLREEEPIGKYAQPRWTARRLFPTTRIYVIPEGTATVEWWLESKVDLEHPKQVRHRSQYELELGLGHRLQLDLYVGTEQQGLSGPIKLHQQKVELRYAFADWGEIPLNPTIYLEAIRQNGGFPKGEVKLLLGGELAPRWHAGVNLVFERELGGEREHEYALTAGVSYTAIDEIFSIGLAAKGELVDVRNDRFGPASYELLAGPTLQWRPTPPMHIDFVGLVGAETEKEGDESETATLVEPTIVVGWEI